uniref:Uncharacterized protein n=1 Tax=Picea glauca TaxID=3330 RepID=A0A124GP61_PICGL|nr:hypothetical protein ABT39_MTgene792 [Picea glauca]
MVLTHRTYLIAANESVFCYRGLKRLSTNYPGTLFRGRQITYGLD